MDSIEKKVFENNNNSNYDSSILTLTKLIESNNLTADEKCTTYIILATTYKRLFDYRSTKKYIDSAKTYALVSKYKEKNLAEVDCQYAYILFDNLYYKDANIIMQKIRASNYAHISLSDKAKIKMQEGYIEYLDNNFLLAEKTYDEALQIMTLTNSCDKPIVYGKQIQLYIKSNQKNKAFETYNAGIKDAIKCNILKYQLYINQMMTNSLVEKKEYAEAFKYYRISDSLHNIYNERDYLLKSMEIANNYIKLKKEKTIAQQKSLLDRRKLYIYSLIFGIVITTLGIAYYLLQAKRNKEKYIALNQQKFTNQLLQNIEEERKRIASELHDGINHELLVLKNNSTDVQKQDINNIIEDVRHISRNLYPAMFEQIGLEQSIISLCEKTTSQGLFTTCEINYENKVDKKTELNIYRIIQEALNNTLKHGKADAAKIWFDSTHKELHLVIKDNGKGFNVKEKEKSPQAFGIKTITQRASFMNSNIEIKSNNKGTEINIIKTHV